MKTKIAIVILVLACIGLGIGLFATKKQGDEQHVSDVKSIEDFSNQVVNANVQLNDFRQTNLALTNDLAASQHELAMTQQQADQLSNSLSAASATLTSTKTSLASAQDQISNLNTHITDLESQNKVLDQHATDLTNTIAQLTVSIENTRNQLAIAETNRAYIESELQKQVAQKAELEHRFSDINEVRAQVKKLKDEMFVARRLQWMKNDTGNKKGAELLMQKNAPSASSGSSATTKTPPNYDLNVEVGSDGSVRVIPPIGTTNSAAH